MEYFISLKISKIHIIWVLEHRIQIHINLLHDLLHKYKDKMLTMDLHFKDAVTPPNLG